MPEINLEDTISAISTPPGEGGIGIVRISGPQAISIADKMFLKNSVIPAKAGIQSRSLDPRVRGDDNLQSAKSHTVHFGYIVDQKNKMIDQVLVTIFRAPKSYTAQDVAEISAHGGMKVVQNILKLTFEYGARQAEPGEFTKRAFLNGRIDLTQAEAVLDLIRAKTDRSVEAALEQLKGKLSKEINDIKDELMNMFAHMEAFLDFPDEDLEIYDNQEFKKRFEVMINRLTHLIQSFSKGEILREGAVVVLVGRPNVGKSSLMNALLDRDRAIVSEIPGTTRDVLEESIELEGIWIRLVDTAGLWSSTNPLDQAAMERAKRYFELGHLFLWMIDASTGIHKEDLDIFNQLKGKQVIPVMNKIDLNPTIDITELKKMISPDRITFISAKTRQGLEELEKKISHSILKHEWNEESALITRTRHKRALETSREALEKSAHAFSNRESLEYVTLDLKICLDALKEFVGELYSEDLLDVIFKEFCIGK